MELEHKDYLQAIKIRPNGCAFQAKIDQDKVGFQYGCYCLINLISLEERFLANKIESSTNKTYWVNDPNLVVKILKSDDGLDFDGKPLWKRQSHCGVLIKEIKSQP